jgi:hypothetical protein
MSSFVVSARENNAEPAILRSYKNPKMAELLYDECKVWEACRATSAATTFFDPIKIGKYGQTFLDGGILYNNPIQLVRREAENIWPGQEPLLVSIGTGSAPGMPFKGNLKTIVQRMKDIVTQTERTANDFYQGNLNMVNNNLLFRFNVTHGMADIGLQEYEEISAIADATQTYLDHGETGKKLAACIDGLLGISLEHIADSSGYASPVNQLMSKAPRADSRNPEVSKASSPTGGSSINHYGNNAEGAIAIYGNQNFSGPTQLGMSYVKQSSNCIDVLRNSLTSYQTGNTYNYSHTNLH